MDYAINAKQSISMDGRAFINRSDQVLNGSTGIYDSINTEDGEILLSKALDEIPSENYNYNFGYRYTIDSTSNLSADFSLGKYSSTKNTYQPNDYYNNSEDTLLRSVNNQYDANTQIDLWSVMVDYEKRFKKLRCSFSYLF
jgi:hypothetical protein